MINASKYKEALLALHEVLVELRTMAFMKATHDSMASVLDIAEILPTLIVRDEDLTDEFRGHLQDLRTINLRFGVALQVFESETRSLP